VQNYIQYIMNKSYIHDVYYFSIHIIVAYNITSYWMLLFGVYSYMHITRAITAITILF
jgi:hypothetical protein